MPQLPHTLLPPALPALRSSSTCPDVHRTEAGAGDCYRAAQTEGRQALRSLGAARPGEKGGRCPIGGDRDCRAARLQVGLGRAYPAELGYGMKHYNNVRSVQDRLEGSAYGPGGDGMLDKEPKLNRAISSSPCSGVHRSFQILACGRFPRLESLRRIRKIGGHSGCFRRSGSSSHQDRSSSWSWLDKSSAVVVSSCETHEPTWRLTLSGTFLSRATGCSVPYRLGSRHRTFGRCETTQDRSGQPTSSCSIAFCIFANSTFGAMTPLPSQTHNPDRLGS